MTIQIDIEKNGTGIEKSGTGIEKSGTGISAVKWFKTCLLSISMAVMFMPVYASSGNSLITSDGDRIEVAFETINGLVVGEGKLDAGYTLIELRSPDMGLEVDGSGSNTQVDGSGSNTQVDGSGSNSDGDDSDSDTLVDGSGSNSDGDDSDSGTLVDGSGSNSDGDDSGSSTQVDGSGSNSEGSGQPWGAVEIAVTCDVADMVVYRFNSDGTTEEVGVYDSVQIQSWSGGRCVGR